MGMVVVVVRSIPMWSRCIQRALVHPPFRWDNAHFPGISHFESKMGQTFLNGGEMVTIGSWKLILILIASSWAPKADKPGAHAMMGARAQAVHHL